MYVCIMIIIVLHAWRVCETTRLFFRFNSPCVAHVPITNVVIFRELTAC